MRDMSEIKTYADYYDKFFYINKDGRFVAKIYTDEGEFIDSIIIPSLYYPLNDVSFKTFHHYNCELVDDEVVIECFDKVKYQTGRCYAMADELSQILLENDIPHNIWCGWLFCGTRLPIHHCWITTGSNDEHLLDLQDNVQYTEYCLEYNKVAHDDTDAITDLITTLGVKRMKGEIPNRVACCNAGRPHPSFYYVGCKTECGDTAREFYRKLIKEFPDHPCKANIDQKGMTKVQKIIFNKLETGN